MTIRSESIQEVFRLSKTSATFEDLIPLYCFPDSSLQKLLGNQWESMDAFYSWLNSQEINKNNLYLYPRLQRIIYWDNDTKLHEIGSFFKQMDYKRGLRSYFDRIDSYIEKNDWVYVIGMSPEQFRLALFLRLRDRIPQSRVRESFLRAYMSVDYGFELINLDLVESCLGSTEWLEDEEEKYVELPEVVTIYRGEGSKSRGVSEAFSWTLSKEQGIWFADRFDQKGVLYKAEIEKEKILGYVRREDEVLVNFKNLNKVREIKRD